MSTRPVVSAEPREVVGKKVSNLRREGILPAVVYGGGQESQNIQLDAREFDVLRRTTTGNTLVDLKIGKAKATPGAAAGHPRAPGPPQPHARRLPGRVHDRGHHRRRARQLHGRLHRC